MATRDDAKPAWFFEFGEEELAPWWGLASCQDHPNADDWFADGRRPEAVAKIQRAKAVCASCPVRQKCLDDALGHPFLDGIWGGLTLTERRAPTRPGKCVRGHERSLYSRWMAGRWRCNPCMAMDSESRKARGAA